MRCHRERLKDERSRLLKNFPEREEKPVKQAPPTRQTNLKEILFSYLSIIFYTVLANMSRGVVLRNINLRANVVA